MKRRSWSPAAIVTWLTVGLVMYAIALGRARPERAGRQPAIPRYYSIYEHLVRCGKYMGYLLDSATGTFVRVPLPAEDHILNTVCSPWCDDQGRTQMVGLLHASGGEAKVALLRYTMPDGQVLDEVEISTTLMGRPCWYPGRSARVLFVAGDGRLYRLSFEETPGSLASGFDDYLRPRPLTWRTEPPGQGSGRMEDLVWPTDPRMERRIILSLRLWNEHDNNRLTRSQLWWLQIGADGAAVEGAGRLTVPAPGVAAEERFPSFGRDPDGRLIAAYLTRPEGQHAWRWKLRLAPVDFDGPDGAPRVITASSVIIDEGGVTGPAMFSMDGHWLYALVGETEDVTRIVRYSVVDAIRRFNEAGREAGTITDLDLDRPDRVSLAIEKTLTQESLPE